MFSMSKKFMHLNKLKNIAGPRLVISMAGGGSKGWDAGNRASYQNPLWSAVYRNCVHLKKWVFPVGNHLPFGKHIKETGSWFGKQVPPLGKPGSPFKRQLLTFFLFLTDGSRSIVEIQLKSLIN